MLKSPKYKRYDKQHCELVAAFCLWIPLLGRTIEIPKGFVWDGASIPRFFWRIFGSPFHPTLIVLGLVHDYLFRKGAKVSKQQADLVLYWISLEDKNSRLKSWLLWFGPRFFGRGSFRKKSINWQPEAE